MAGQARVFEEDMEDLRSIRSHPRAEEDVELVYSPLSKETLDQIEQHWSAVRAAAGLAAEDE